jgi:PAS domain S-box-containing protein
LARVFSKVRAVTTADLRRLTALLDARTAEALFDLAPDTVFFVKDGAGRYAVVNRTLVARCGRKTKDEVIGRTVAELFPADLARTYAEQDRRVIASGRPMVEKLELHLYRDGRPGWCLTSKLPLRDAAGKVAGLVGLSRDLAAPDAARVIPPELADAIGYLEAHYDEPLTTATLARLAGMSVERFSRLVKRIYLLTPGQLITQTRLQEATRRLRETDERVADIAAACGYYDHSAFARQFKAATGLTPLGYRAELAAGGPG